jgi:hypothetical protein
MIIFLVSFGIFFFFLGGGGGGVGRWCLKIGKEPVSVVSDI